MKTTRMDFINELSTQRIVVLTKKIDDAQYF